MVKQTKKRDKLFYICEECGFVYKSKDMAQKCENWCKKYKSCNVDITKHAVKIG